MPDSSDIDNAVVAKLGADPTLLGLCPNGVYFDVIPPQSTRFVQVSLVTAHDETTFDGPAVEAVLYAVKAVMLNPPSGDINAAAERIQDLLNNQPLTVPGYTYSTMHRDEDDPRIRYTEPDPANTAKTWFHRGGNYRVEMAVG